jgi:hypothetical protein
VISVLGSVVFGTTAEETTLVLVDVVAVTIQTAAGASAHALLVDVPQDHAGRSIAGCEVVAQAERGRRVSTCAAVRAMTISHLGLR